MIQNSVRLLVAFLFIGFIACESSKYDTTLLLGDWNGASWTVEDGKNRSADAIKFSFSEDGSYSAGYGAQLEKGTYRMAGDKLYTTETGKIEKMVKVVQLTADSLAFEMNRMGTYEQILLVKAK